MSVYWYLVISGTYFLSNILVGQSVKSTLICVLFRDTVKKNNARLQWYSCARHKAPGPLVCTIPLAFWSDTV